MGKINTAGQANGEYDLWMDYCGTNGLGCGGPGTLRTHYTDVQWVQSNGLTPSGAASIGGVWLEQYSSGNGVDYQMFGEWQWDQIVASRVRVGPMAVGGAPSAAPPARPGNLVLK